MSNSSATRTPFLDTALDGLTMAQAVAACERFIPSRTPHVIFGLNVALYVWARSNPEMRDFYERCELLVPDGMGVYYASQLLGRPLPDMVSTVLLMLELLPVAARRGYSVYLLGTRQDILDRALAQLRQQHPTLRIAGSHHGFFTPAEEEDVVCDIAGARPDLLFIGMSSPLKERFVERYKARLGVPVIIGVGGGIDVIAGVYKLSPLWMRRAGLEWLYRLVQEPRRLWKRYLTTNSIFGWLVLKAWLAASTGNHTATGRTD